MQDTKRNAYKTGNHRTLQRAFALVVLGLGLQACQTAPQRYLTADEWNARTNAVNAFSNAVHNFNQSQVPTYGGAAPQRPVIYQQNIQQQPSCAPFCFQNPPQGW